MIKIAASQLLCSSRILVAHCFIFVTQASESGTSNSVTSAEDLQKLAVILGLNSAEDVYQERFRVDRRRLETMLAGNKKISTYIIQTIKAINPSKMYY